MYTLAEMMDNSFFYIFNTLHYTIILPLDLVPEPQETCSRSLIGSSLNSLVVSRTLLRLV